MATKKLQILNSLVSHDTLTNLDAADQHPIEAVTGLKEALGGKADLVDGKIPVEQIPDDIGGGVTSWNDLEDKPFYEEEGGWSIEYDGGTTDEYIELGEDMPTFYKVFDIALDKKDIAGADLTVRAEETINMTVSYSMLIDVNGSCYAAIIDDTPLIFVTTQTTEFEMEGVTLSFPSAGVWFMNMNDYCYPAYLGKENIKTLDPKYLPKGSIGYEKGEKILWDGSPTDTYIQPGQIIEWDGSDTGVSLPVPANEAAGIPEGLTFYKVAEKLDTLEGWYYQEMTADGYVYGSRELTSENVETIFDDSGNVIVSYGTTNGMQVWNVKQAVPFPIMGGEFVFPETGLYFMNIEGQVRVQNIHNVMYEELEEIKLYKISEPLNDDLNGYRMNYTSEGESYDIFVNDNEAYDENAYYGSTDTGSSYGLPYIFNVVTDNESIDCMDDYGAIFKFEKAGLYVIDFSAMEVTFNYIAGRDFEVIKIDKKFLPDDAQLKSERSTWIDTSDDYYPTTGAIYRALGYRNQLSIQSDVNSWSGDPVSSQAVYNALGGRSSLTIDSTVDSSSNNPVSSQAVYNALGGRSQLTIDDDYWLNSLSHNPVSSATVYRAIENSKTIVDSTVQSGSSNAVSGNAVYNALGGRSQLTIDSSVTNGSSNPVSSSAVYNALQNIDLSSKQDKISVTTSDNGKFMRVVDGTWAAVAVPNAEGGEF